MAVDDPASQLCHPPAGRPSAARTMLLISVRESKEVGAAIAGGADWLDLKEPTAGPLGAVPVGKAKQIISRVAGRLPISAALGELREWNKSSAHSLLDLSEIQVVKLGLSCCAKLSNWESHWHAMSDVISQSGQELAAVAYADWQLAEAPSPVEVIAAAEEAGSHYFLLDTFDKKAGSLLTHLSVVELQDTLHRAKAASLKTLVAGSLKQSDLAKLALAEIDMIGVRGGVCDGDRTAEIDSQLVADFRAAMT